MNEVIFKDFFGKEVILLLDAKASHISGHSGAAHSLEAIAKISEKQVLKSNFLKLDYIKYKIKEYGAASYFGQGAIQKNYIIGIFEKQKH